MYNADIKMNEEELEGWVKSFPQKMKMGVNRVLPLAWHINSRNVASVQSENRFGLEFRHFQLEENGELLLDVFDKFVGRLKDRVGGGNGDNVLG